MPRLSEPAAIRALLETDRAWAAYALADLAPGFFEHCEWRSCQQPAPAIILLYRAFAIPVLVTVGPAPAIAGLLDEIRAGHPSRIENLFLRIKLAHQIINALVHTIIMRHYMAQDYCLHSLIY